MLDVTELSGVYMTVKEASDYIPITGGRLRQMLRSREIRGVSVSDAMWLIPIDEVERVKSIRHERGRPRTKGSAGK